MATAVAQNPKAEVNGKAAPKDDPAEKTLVADLPLSPRVKNILDREGVRHVRHLIKRMRDNVEHWWRDMKGLGETGFDEIQTAMSEFWKKHPDAQ
jgi:hypothetical protein